MLGAVGGALVIYINSMAAIDRGTGAKPVAVNARKEHLPAV